MKFETKFKIGDRVCAIDDLRKQEKLDDLPAGVVRWVRVTAYSAERVEIEYLVEFVSGCYKGIASHVSERDLSEYPSSREPFDRKKAKLIVKISDLRNRLAELTKELEGCQ